MTFTFRMYLPDGSEAGDYVTAVPGPWNIGEKLYEGGAAKYRIADKLQDDVIESDYAGIWVVEPV